MLAKKTLMIWIILGSEYTGKEFLSAWFETVSLFQVLLNVIAHTGSTSNARPVSLRFASAQTLRAVTMSWKQVRRSLAILRFEQLSSRIFLCQVPPVILRHWSERKSSWSGKRWLTGRSWRTTQWSCWRRGLLQGMNIIIWNSNVKYFIFVYFVKLKYV